MPPIAPPDRLLDDADCVAAAGDVTDGAAVAVLELVEEVVAELRPWSVVEAWVLVVMTVMVALVELAATTLE